MFSYVTPETTTGISFSQPTHPVRRDRILTEKEMLYSLFNEFLPALPESDPELALAAFRGSSADQNAQPLTTASRDDLRRVLAATIARWRLRGQIDQFYLQIQHERAVAQLLIGCTNAGPQHATQVLVSNFARETLVWRVPGKYLTFPELTAATPEYLAPATSPTRLPDIASATPTRSGALSSYAPKVIRRIECSGEQQHLSVFSADGRRCLRTHATGDGWITRQFVLSNWDTETGERILRIEPPKGERILSVAISPDNRLALSGSSDYKFTCWGMSDGRRVTQHETKWGVDQVAFSPDGRFMAAGMAGGCTVWEISTDRIVGRVSWAKGEPTHLRFSPDGRCILVGTNTGKLAQFNWLNGECIWEHVLSEWPTGDQFVKGQPTLDGMHLLTTSWDNVLRKWDVKSGKSLATIDEVVRACALPGDTAIFKGTDQALRYWSFEENRCLQIVQDVGLFIDFVRSDGRQAFRCETEAIEVLEL